MEQHTGWGRAKQMPRKIQIDVLNCSPLKVTLEFALLKTSGSISNIVQEFISLLKCGVPRNPETGTFLRKIIVGSSKKTIDLRQKMKKKTFLLSNR